MKEWYVRFIRDGEEEALIVLSSRWKLLLWLVQNLRRCRYVTFFASAFYEDMYEEEL